MEQIRYPFSERVLRDMHSAVLVLDARGCIVYVNAPAARMLELDEGYRAERVRFSLLAENEYNDSFSEAILEALYKKDETTVRKVPYMAPSGRKYVFLLSSSYLRAADSEEAQLVVTLSDETAAEETSGKLSDS